jgi:hypothetical protein
MRRLSLFISVLILGVSTAKAMPYKNAEEGDLKFGTKGVFGPFYQHGGAFVEYKLNQEIGIESGLVWNKRNIYIIKDSLDNFILVNPNYVSIPLTFRLYPGKDRQSSLFLGFQVGYLIGGIVLRPTSYEDNEKLLKGFLNDKLSLVKSIKEEPDKSNFAVIMDLGYSYEFKMGLILGFNLCRNLTSVLKADDTSEIPFPNLYFGWNFAGLLKN